MSDLLSRIEAKEREIQAQFEKSEKEKEVIVGQYRDKAFQEIGKMKSESEQRKKEMLEVMNDDLRSFKSQVDAQTQNEKMRVDAQFEKHKQQAKQLLIKEVLFDGDR
ncbi:hypothetical protein AOC36_09940 [Erysipelothrix larvae]|uniref:Uncharacterized protein n=1 Tax=Erysipelothrix larvae TaxID=1514105 RepID=A0A0X8H1G5_9FIRM|nr:hypothetical protein [Erysipelothrix larvae]AMC94281.1 hypothetical protein AOC36_09940 [Erysipelothrix larvae]